MISAAQGNSKVKAVVSLDPWMTPYQASIKACKLKAKDVNQHHFVISTEKFAQSIDSVSEFNLLKVQE